MKYHTKQITDMDIFPICICLNNKIIYGLGNIDCNISFIIKIIKLLAIPR